MTTSIEPLVRWRVSGDYLPTNASKAGLLDETRQFLLTYQRLQSLAAARRALVDGELPQRARATRVTIVEVIQRRLTRWSPPAWVLDDLVGFAATSREAALPSVLLLHTARQDTLMYEFIQHELVPRWQQGDHVLVRADVQRFLDQRESEHAELLSWSHSTREKLAGNVLSILRDYGLLIGRASKRIIEPLVPLSAAEHLIRLLRAEGIANADLARHPDWQIWLWDAARAQKIVRAILDEEVLHERSR
ncbi:BrxA family protein [Candidatus Chloroploca asiatica]|uniref:DUF1819 domain-containing protein n=1 Tax=Candidatus Chloroploca asiatica TaxID=1506545 RepID=A0A2H3LCP2_9CHLR|nr:BrxA family protein [Candidatus Chloroploca asiatica]PDW00258.1 hypothetical protein A9Q02_10590 [Candidatus Chloroploca asiatica]